MEIKAALIDFDGTLVTGEILDIVCGIPGKMEESIALNDAFQNGPMGAMESLIARINLLKGVTVQQVRDKLEENPYLMPGAEEFAAYLKGHGITTAITSGNITPVLDYYKDRLGMDYVIGTSPIVENGVIQGVPNEVELKYPKCVRLLADLGISPEHTLAVGDSKADKVIFENLAGYSIAINPRGGIEAYAKAVIRGDLRNAIPIIDRLLNE